jgi:hypothetical protein
LQVTRADSARAREIDVTTKRSGDGEQSLTGLAKRWLKLQFQFHGDPHRGVRDRREAEAIESELEDRVKEDVGRAAVMAAMPRSWREKLESFQEQATERQAAAEQERRARHAARPRARLRLSLTGAISGSLEVEVPADVIRPGEAGDPLLVVLESLEPEPLGGHTFLGVQFAVPSFTGPGRYDLAAMGQEEPALDWDPLWFQLWIDQTDEPFFWSPGVGPGTIDVAADGRTLRARFKMQGAAGDVELDAGLILPA